MIGNGRSYCESLIVLARRISLMLAVIFISIVVSDPSRAAGTNVLDVIGIELGMSIEEVAAIASTRSLAETARNAAPSFDQAVAIARGKVIQFTDFESVQRLSFSNEQETVEVIYAQSPDGAKVATVTYRLLAGKTAADFQAEVLDKYGASDEEQGSLLVWGDTRARYLRTEPYLEFDTEPPAGFGPAARGMLTLMHPTAVKDSRAAISKAARN